MQTFRRAKSALDDVSAASQQVIETTEYASIALVAVATVSLLALIAACVALSRVSADA